MKKYRLKINYPSLFQEHKKGDIVYYNSLTKNYVKAEAPHYSVSAYDVENFPDCWELIEEQEPLFVTEDGVDLFDLCQTVYLIHPKTFMKQKSYLGYFSTNDLDNNKLFYHESNADEYIWRNKPVFSYNDIKKFQSGGEGVWYDVKAIAKERIKQ